MRLYLILGYGVPKDIMTDDSYRRYLGVAFNTVYVDSQTQTDKAVIVFSGGYTDCFPPYKRTEAVEMARLFKHWAMRPFCRSVTKRWQFVLEKKSLSTLANLVNASQIMAARNMKPRMLTVFCEATRIPRIRGLLKKIFPGQACKLIPIDFDLSKNRYLDPEFILRKEKKVGELDLWALENPKNMKKYNKAFVDKIAFLREAGPKRHVDAINEWWKKTLAMLEKESYG